MWRLCVFTNATFCCILCSWAFINVLLGTSTNPVVEQKHNPVHASSERWLTGISNTMGDKENQIVLIKALVLHKLARLTYRHFAYKQQWFYGECCSCPGPAFMIPLSNQISWPSTEHFYSHTFVGCSFCGQWRIFSFKAVKVFGLGHPLWILHTFTHQRLWRKLCSGLFSFSMSPAGLWQHLIRLQVCLLSRDTAECQVREQRHSIKAKSLEAFMGTIQFCPALEDKPEFSPGFHFL